MKVRTVDEVDDAGAKAAVTPVGRPETVNVAAAVNPPWSTTLIVLVAVPPCATVTADGVAVRVKPGAAVDGECDRGGLRSGAGGSRDGNGNSRTEGRGAARGKGQHAGTGRGGVGA